MCTPQKSYEMPQLERLELEELSMKVSPGECGRVMSLFRDAVEARQPEVCFTRTFVVNIRRRKKGVKHPSNCKGQFTLSECVCSNVQCQWVSGEHKRDITLF